jgi:hypothetical protein
MSYPYSHSLCLISTMLNWFFRLPLLLSNQSQSIIPGKVMRERHGKGCQSKIGGFRQSHFASMNRLVVRVPDWVHMAAVKGIRHGKATSCIESM